MIIPNKTLEKFKKDLVKLCIKYKAKLIHYEEGIAIEFILDNYDEWGRRYQDSITAITPSGVCCEDD